MRAIHLEIRGDLSAREFLQALWRSIARRGTPKEIILDNASQYELAKSTVDIAWEKLFMIQPYNATLLSKESNRVP